jgi:SAM-dependent methyltransferase
MELLLGCGNSRHKRFSCHGKAEWLDLITLDIDPDCKPDVIWDMSKLPLPLRDDTFDECHAYHVLEHMGTQGDWRFFLDQFADFWRILKPGGTFCGVVPDLASRWLWGDPGHTRALSIEALTFLSQDEYDKQVGVTNMTDYRHWYKADFTIEFAQIVDEELRFALKAKK